MSYGNKSYSNGGSAKKPLPCGKVETWEVTNVRDTKAGIFFTLILNGVTVNNCHVTEQKDGRRWISLPSYKGSDGNWYNTVYFKFTDEDQSTILDAVKELA